MRMSRSLFSTLEQVEFIKRALVGYMRLPFFTGSIPGAVMESVFSFVRGGDVLNTYDFVDVVDGKIGWQVKSTKAETPVTWKRAKIANAEELISQSYKSKRGLQELGNAIIDFCNDHAAASIDRYSLDRIGYVRLVVHQKESRVDYFERQLCTESDPRVFRKEEFSWGWSTPKRVRKKEQLMSLIGTKKDSSEKWFAWHGLGENQLHFSGERAWWPEKMHSFELPSADTRLSWQDTLAILTNST